MDASRVAGARSAQLRKPVLANTKMCHLADVPGPGRCLLFIEDGEIGRPVRELTLKRAYSTPRLTVHGSVERITLANRKGRQNNHGNRNNNAADPGQNCNQGQGAFCS